MWVGMWGFVSLDGFLLLVTGPYLGMLMVLGVFGFELSRIPSTLLDIGTFMCRVVLASLWAIRGTVRLGRLIVTSSVSVAETCDILTLKYC